MSLLDSPSSSKMLVSALRTTVGTPLTAVMFRSRKVLKREDDVPMTKPTWSKPATQRPSAGMLPLVKLEARYFVRAKPKVVGSHVPSSKALNSNTVELREMMVVLGALPSATRMGKGA